MKKIGVSKPRDVYGEACLKCGKIIKGFSPKQVTYNLNFHKERKHGRRK